jgi:hypothetical protein
MSREERREAGREDERWNQVQREGGREERGTGIRKGNR